MEIKIRNVPDEVVAKLNRKAKEKGLSREEFLREQLKLISLDIEIKLIQDREELMMNRLIKVLDMNTNVLSSFMKENCINYEEVFEDE